MSLEGIGVVTVVVVVVVVVVVAVVAVDIGGGTFLAALFKCNLNRNTKPRMACYRLHSDNRLLCAAQVSVDGRT